MKESNVKIERDALSEYVRLKKETHLLEHGFYDEQIRKELGEIISQSIFRRTKNCGLNDWMIIARRDWFRKKFPEFFVIL